MKTRIWRFILGVLVAVGGASPAFAQTTLNSTTISAAITSTSQTSLTVASATGITAPGTGATLVYLLIDREVLQVRAVNGTGIQVTRGQLSTVAATHISGATVWVAPAAGGTNQFIPSGQCQRTLLPFVPYMVVGGPSAGRGAEVGTLWDCLGLTTAGQWVQTNDVGIGFGVLGTTVASATTVTGTGSYFKMSGTVNPVSTITVPAGASAGFTFQIEPTGAWVTDTAGNILIASTASVGKLMLMTWNGAKWVPSY